MSTDIDAVADELYGLPLGEFTSTRNARAKQARSEGERELAGAIQELVKPTTSAWLVNQLTRELADQLAPFIDLGRDLREASTELSGDDLRALTRQRHELVHALVQQARRIGRAGGQQVSEEVAGEVRRTLEASLADPEVADAVLAGRMTRAADYAGFGVAGFGGGGFGVAGDTATARTRDEESEHAGEADVTDLAARRRVAAEREVDEAARRLGNAAASREKARGDSAEVTERLEAAEQEVSDLRATLEQAAKRADEAAAADRAARERLDRAEREAGEAEEAHAQAQRRLRDLPSP